MNTTLPTSEISTDTLQTVKYLQNLGYVVTTDVMCAYLQGKIDSKIEAMGILLHKGEQ